MVLYQVLENNEQRPIEWALKKLTLIKTRYGISEKELLAIFGDLKKF